MGYYAPNLPWFLVWMIYIHSQGYGPTGPTWSLLCIATGWKHVTVASEPERIGVFLTRSCVHVTDISCGVVYEATLASLVLFRSYCYVALFLLSTTGPNRQISSTYKPYKPHKLKKKSHFFLFSHLLFCENFSTEFLKPNNKRSNHGSDGSRWIFTANVGIWLWGRVCTMKKKALG